MSERSISSPLKNCENMVRECTKKPAKKRDSISESNPVHKREKEHVLPHQLDKYNHENTLAADFSAAFASGYSTPSEQGPCHNFINPLLPHQLRKYNHENTLVADFSAAFVHGSRISSESESTKKMEKPLPHQMNAYRHGETMPDFSAAFVSGNTTFDSVSFHRVQHLPHQSEKYQHENSLAADLSAVLATTNYSEPSVLIEENIHLPHLIPPRASDGFSFQLVENYTETIDEPSSCQAEQTMCNTTSQVEEVENNSAVSNFKNSLFSDSSVEPMNTGEYCIGASFTKHNYTYTLPKSVPATVDSFKYEPANRTYSIHRSNSVCNEVPSINCEDAVHDSCLQVENHELCAPETPSACDEDNKLSSINNIKDVPTDNVKEEKTLSVTIVRYNDINESLRRIFEEDVPLNDCLKLVESEVENDTSERHMSSNNYNLVLHDNPNEVIGTEPADTNDEHFEDVTLDAGLLVQESHAPYMNVSGITNEESGNKSKDVVADAGIEDVQENEAEDTNDEHFNDVVRDAGFNDEGSHVLSINEGSRNKSKDEELDDGLNDVQESLTPSPNDSGNRNERHVSSNISGDIVLDDGPNDFALSINKSGDINEGSGNKSKDVALDDGIEDVKGNVPENTTNGHFEDVARDTVFNDERSNVLSINESSDINEQSRNKSKDEALDDSLNDVQESHTLSLNEIVNEGFKNKSSDVAVNDSVEDVQENELEDTNDEHLDDVARDAGFNDEGSHIMSINEESRNNTKNETLDADLNSVQERNTPPLNESRNLNEVYVSENKSGGIVLDDDLNDVALSVNKSEGTNERHASGINSKNVASFDDDVNGNEESPPPSSAIAISTSKKNLSAEENSRSMAQNDCSEESHASSLSQLTNCYKSKSDLNSLYPNNSRRNRTSNINTASDFATPVKFSVTGTQVSEQNNFANFLFNSSESTETSPLSRNIGVESVAARRKKITRKRSGRLLDLEDDATEFLPKKPSFPKFDAYQGPEFYKLLIEKMESKYGIKTNKEVVALSKYISETVQQVIREKNRDVYIPLINQMKVVLARKQVVRTNWEFYEFCMRRLPCGFKVKAVPSYNPISAPFQPDTIFKAILEE